jgi:predicted DNA-binding antitoxin AbrB/MazE fold protein
MVPPLLPAADSCLPSGGSGGGDKLKFMRTIEALYEDGLLKPQTPLSLRPGERVAVIVLRQPDPNRWNLDRLARVGREEDLALSEQGLAQWSDALEAEDRS